MDSCNDVLLGYCHLELATRLAYLWGAQALASCCSGIISFGVFRLDGWISLQGWKWLFLIDGVFTHLIGLVAFMYLPASPTQSSLFLKSTRWLTQREKYIAKARVIRDDAIKEHDDHPLTWQDVKLTLSDLNMYMHLLITFLGLMPNVPIHTYLPSLICSFGFPVTWANLLAAPAVMIGLFFSVQIAASSDRHGQVALHGLIGTLWSLVGFVMMRLLPEQVDTVNGGRWTFYLIVLFTAATPSWHGMQIAWMSSNLAPIGKRTLALGAVISAANLNGVPGSMIYRSNDSPLYRHGNMICIYLQIATTCLWLIQRTRYTLKNKSREQKWSKMTHQEKEIYIKTTSDVGNNRLDYRFHL
ncbi:major facilitator superfamily domain-containing protein [Halteromyces radiatus]|uniref:major facilitator superfamily domain-containing protein n=1 Tax=Halteromyces radiatus TaxID=101107 RepID=UPI00221F7F90|nr:major facilitator superfamily domain-containing protein [Halteromyces radiatus]KAI8092669.1 major facilitator superfamily domain-containing protein [Halteromyces radiatus]